uniref:Metalloendopeptidase n=1 Tax=Panagrellus redivivus TaxID=6233 RepID=A0A7E4ZZE0_PANRE
MHHWENHTCVSFVPYRPGLHRDYIIFTTDKCGCCSYVGRRGDGEQIISIGKNCDKFGIIVHELGHVVGFSHEHTRPDRDDYVEIFRKNIQDGQDYNFDKAKPDEINTYGQTYDYQSIMHYARDTFARGAYLDTILPRKPAVGERPKIGQRTKLSDGDIRQTNKMYRCPACYHTLLSESGEMRYNDGQKQCHWRVISAIGERVMLNVSAKLLPKMTAKSCLYEEKSYIEIRDGFTMTSQLLGKICHGTSVKNFTSSQNAITLIVISSNFLAPLPFARFKAVCGGIITGTSGIVQSPRYPEPYPANQNCVWQISVPVGYRVAIIFRYFSIESHKACSYDRLEVYEGTNDTEDNLIARLCGHRGPKYLTANNSNTAIVKFFSDASIQKTGFSLEFLREVNECETSDHRCEHICINHIGGYHCDCRSGFALRADGHTCESTCGGELPLGKGEFSSPNFPEPYDSSKKCIWEIKANPGYRIVVNFTTFNVEGLKSECEYDHVQVKPVNGMPGTDEVRLCGEYTEPIVLLSQTNELRVAFSTDNSMERSGFTATYFSDYDECAKDNGGCEQICINIIDSYECQCYGGVSLAEDGHSCSTSECSYQSYEPFGTIQSTDFPKAYPTGKNCTWHILTTPGHRILLTFEFFDVEDHYSCRYDHVSIYDGGDQLSRSLGTFCGMVPPPSVSSSGNQMFVVLRSDETQPRRGFNASYTSECGGRLKADSTPGFVYSHARYGDRKYAKMTKCVWEIYAEAGTGVKLEFTQFDIEKERGCEYDFVSIYDGLAKQDKLLIGQFCGDDLPGAITSSANGLLIEFVTDDNVEQKGFVFQYASSPAFKQPTSRRTTTVQPSDDLSARPILNN